MNEFGVLLRNLREGCRDPLFPVRKLSQVRLGELLGQELGTHRYTGAAVSDWERGKSKIHAADRTVLICLAKVLHKCGGLTSLGAANEFLESGNYRRLNPDETKILFPEGIIDTPLQEPPSFHENVESRQSFIDTVGEYLSTVSKAFQAMVVEARNGPSPYWPRVLAALMRKATDNRLISITSFLWIAIWYIAWRLIGPSLRWPFTDQYSAFSAIVMYVGGTLVVPLLIGLLINTKDSEYWKQQGLADSTLVRLYTYQGAGIGFNLAYFFVLPLVLVRYYLNLGSSIWLEFAAVTLGLILGNMSARVVPHNLWLAYGRLRFADGAIFLVVALVGPLWGVFFLEFYSVLLTPLLGISVILFAFILVVIMAQRQSKKER